jgi:hypothetical protein
MSAFQDCKQSFAKSFRAILSCHKVNAGAIEHLCDVD